MFWNTSKITNAISALSTVVADKATAIVTSIRLQLDSVISNLDVNHKLIHGNKLLNEYIQRKIDLLTKLSNSRHEEMLARSIALELKFDSLTLAVTELVEAINNENTTNPEPTNPVLVKDRLGFNFTWSADKQINTDNALPGSLASHCRLFVMKEKDLDNEYPQTYEEVLAIQPAPIRENVWENPVNSMRENLDRVLKLRQMFEGIIFLSPEAPLGNRLYPNKDFGPAYWESVGQPIPKAEYKEKGFLFGYNYMKAALETYKDLGVVLEFFNEPRDESETEFWIGYMEGGVKAHIENPSCGLALGDIYLDTATGKGVGAFNEEGPLHAPVGKILRYLNDIGGFVGVHPYPLIPGPAFTDDFELSETFTQGVKLIPMLKASYPNLFFYAGEFGYTSRTDGKTIAKTVREDYEVTLKGLKILLEYYDFILIYQAYGAKYEQLFGGTALLPYAAENLRKFTEAEL